MTLHQKVSNLLVIRAQIDEAKKAVETLQGQRDDLQQNIVESLKKQKMLSFRGQDATVAIKTSKNLSIIDKNLVISQLKEKGLDDYVTETIDMNLWRGFSSEAIKQGMEIAGTQLIEKEYISVTKAKGKEENE